MTDEIIVGVPESELKPAMLKCGYCHRKAVVVWRNDSYRLKRHYKRLFFRCGGSDSIVAKTSEEFAMKFRFQP